MNKKILCMVLIITLIGSMFLLNTKVKAASGDNVVVQFNDKALWDAMVYRFNCVESSSANKTITYTEEQLKNIKDITITYGDGANISDLTGLERFTSLEHLTIQNTRLLDFTPIKNLKLTHLDLTSGQIKDLSWISGMTTLKILVLYDNQITNIAPLANLTELTGLNLRGNNISDVSALSKLTKLTVFDITGNSNITDIQVIRNFSKIESLDLENLPKANVMQALQNCVDLSKIKKLNISNNNIEDISVLSGATSLEALWAANNKISNIDALSNCKKLNTLYLNGNKNITDISAVAELEELKELQVQGNHIANFSPLQNLQNLKYLDISNNGIEDISTLEDLDLQGDLTAGNQVITVGAKLGETIQLPNIFKQVQNRESIGYTSEGLQFSNCTLMGDQSTVKVQEEGKAASITIKGGLFNGTKLNIIFVDEDIDIKFNDTTLYWVLREMLAPTKVDDPNLTMTLKRSKVDSVIQLNLFGYYNISDLTGIEKFTNLKVLRIENGNLKNLSTLENLKLRNLALENCKIDNISVLEDMQTLEELDLYNNMITDVSNLSKLTNLKKLTIGNNKIEDISVIRNFPNLVYLNLNNLSKVKNILQVLESNLQHLDKIEYLMLNGVNISDITMLSGATSLKYLELEENKIQNINALASCTHLYDLRIQYNNITDISPLADLTELEEINLSYNSVKNIDALEKLSKLSKLYLVSNNVEDVKVLEDLQNLVIADFRWQSYKVQAKEGATVQLPKIFEQAKQSNSQVYTDKELKTENCNLNENGTEVVIGNNATNALVTIEGGNANGTQLQIGVQTTSVQPGQQEHEDGEEGQAQKDGQQVQGQEVEQQKSSQIKKLPYAGESVIWLGTALLIIIIGAYSYIRYKNILK